MPLLWCGGANGHLVTAVILVLLATVASWLGFREWAAFAARDFEECAERVQANTVSNRERNALLTDCNTQFAGRRKSGGGYTYYDFMQDRSFDLAGPNPTMEERKRIDRESMAFLDAQRREALSAELAKGQNEQLQAKLENARQPIAPTILAPLNPASAAAKRPLDQSRAVLCNDGSLACSWESFRQR
jgi:hypothetical protein